MEYSVSTKTMDDAEDLFIVAKERLLDVNDWTGLHRFNLIDSHNNKLHRSAHAGDFIKKDSNPEESLVINKIQYDDYPDIAGESITLFLATVSDPESMHTIAINRVGKLITIQGHNVDFSGDAAQFLKLFIATEEYAIAS